MPCLRTRVAIAALTLLLPVSSHAATFTFCMKWRVATTDSGRTVTLPDGSNITEDYWASDTPQLQTAHGMLLTAHRPGLNGGVPILLWADPATGCATLTDTAGTHGYILRAYAVSNDAHSNTLRILDPLEQPYYFDVAVQATSGTAVTVPVPANSFASMTADQKGIATLAAVSAFSLYRSTFGLGGKWLDIIEGAASSAHSGPGVDLSQLSHGHIRISIHKPTQEDPSDHRRMKFIVSHEMGHAWLLLNHGGGVEPNVALDYDASADPAVCHYVANDGSNDTYTIDSLEYNAVGFREGTAHFYAARVWNDPKPEGVFTWFAGNGRSLARFPAGDLGGGRTFQQCVTPSRALATLCADNVTTNEDWLRFWWAWHTRTNPGVPTTLIRNLYERTWDNGGLLEDNYLSRLSTAVSQLVPDPNQIQAFITLGDWFGISSGQNTRCQ
jgi:hypothetical protein